MRNFCQNWLFVVAIAHVIAGLAVPLFAYSDLFDLYGAQIAAAFWSSAPVPAAAEAYQRWMVALFGPTVAAWGVLMAFLVKAGQRSGAAWPWNALLLSILAWAPADIAISLLHDFWPHVVIDCLMLLLIGVPALLLRVTTAGNGTMRAETSWRGSTL